MRLALSKEAPPALFGELLAEFPGTTVIVQRNARDDEVEAFLAAYGLPALDLSHVNDDVEDMLALSGLLDRYIGVSNTMTHLRAAQNKPSHVFAPLPAEFRWMNSGENSPWFPGSTVFRQSSDGSWSAAFEKCAAALMD